MMEPTLGELLIERAYGGDEAPWTSEASDSDSPRPVKRAREAAAPKKRASKNAPMEVSSKKKRGGSEATRGKKASQQRDPRFEAACGTLRPEVFRKSYEFLEEHEAAEIESLARVDKRSAERLRSQRGSRQAREQQARVKADLKRKEREAVATGKRPYFLKKAAVKAEVLNAKFTTLRAAGKLNKFLRRQCAKKRRRGDDEES